MIRSLRMIRLLQNLKNYRYTTSIKNLILLMIIRGFFFLANDIFFKFKFKNQLSRFRFEMKGFYQSRIIFLIETFFELIIAYSVVLKFWKIKTI